MERCDSLIYSSREVGEGQSYTTAIINYKQDELISDCLSGIQCQSIQPDRLLIIDNSFQLDTKYLDHNKAQLVHPTRNLGYAGGCNLALSLCHTKYIVFMNTDVILTPNYVSTIITYMEEHLNVAAASGLLLHYNFNTNETTNSIDSAGIEFSRAGRFWDRGQGLFWEGQYQTGPVFGVSGAAVLFRVDALHSIAINDEIFDEDLFAYKEDIDISWRLRSSGWESVVVMEAIGYHGRAVGGSVKGWREHLKSRRSHSLNARRLSFKNQILILLKNGNKKDIDYWNAIFRQFSIFIFTCIFEPKVLAVIPNLLHQIPKIVNKRRLQKLVIKKANELLD